MNITAVFVVLVIVLWLTRTGRIARLYGALTGAPGYGGNRRGGGSSFR